MITDFFNIINSLNRSDSNELVEKLQQMFSSISKMKADEVVSAYQTLTTTAKAISKTDDEIVKTMLQAMENRMLAIGSEPLGRSSRKYFNSVTGKPLFLFDIFSI